MLKWDLEHWEEELKEQHQLRQIIEFERTGAKAVRDGQPYYNFSTNDYLGLAQHSEVIAAHQAAAQIYGTSVSSSRLVTGSLKLHRQLERTLAEFLGFEDGVLFGSGALTNLGVIPAIVGKGDAIVADRFVHATMIDGALASRAKLFRWHHNDLNSLEQTLQQARSECSGKILLLCESLYSMEGDVAPLAEMTALAESFQAALLVDEAHAIGVYGQGRGVVAELGLSSRVDFVTGTLSKACASYGGFVLSSGAARRYFENHARTLIYSTGLPPSVVAAALKAIDIMRRPENLTWGGKLLQRADRFRSQLHGMGYNTNSSVSHIVPVQCGSNEIAVTLAKRLEEQGCLGLPIRRPTVPSPRLRLALSYAHSEEALQTLVDALQKSAR